MAQIACKVRLISEYSCMRENFEGTWQAEFYLQSGLFETRMHQGGQHQHKFNQGVLFSAALIPGYC